MASISCLQLHSGWKLCFNECSIKWLKPSFVYKINSIRVITTINRVWRCLYELQSSYTFHDKDLSCSIQDWWTDKVIFEKVVVCVKKGMLCILLVEYNNTYGSNQVEKIWRLYIFQEFIKKADFFASTSISKRLQI